MRSKNAAHSLVTTSHMKIDATAGRQRSPAIIGKV